MSVWNLGRLERTRGLGTCGDLGLWTLDFGLWTWYCGVEMAADEDLYVLVTACIRKQPLQATKLNHFPLDARNTHREHFIELDVIIRKHHEVFAQRLFNAGVQSLLILREHFNEPRNIFKVSDDINRDKKILTHYFLTNTPFLEPISNDLRRYIQEASAVSLQFVKELRKFYKTSETFNDLRRVLWELRKYIVWLQDLINN